MPPSTEKRREVGRGAFGVVELVETNEKRWTEKKGIMHNQVPLNEAKSLQWIYSHHERNEAAKYCVEYFRHEVIPKTAHAPGSVILHMAPYASDGHNFITKLAQKKELYNNIIISIFEQMKGALDWLHTKGVLHFDLTWRNTLINSVKTEKGALKPYLVISDFGSAMIKPHHTKSIEQEGSILAFQHITVAPVTSVTSRDPLFFGHNFSSVMTELKGYTSWWANYNIIRESGASQASLEQLPETLTINSAPPIIEKHAFINKLWALGCHADYFALHACLGFILAHHPHYAKNQDQYKPLLSNAMAIKPSDRQEITVSNLRSLLNTPQGEGGQPTKRMRLQ